MRFIDLEDGQVYDLRNLYNDYIRLRAEEPENHAGTFRMEVLGILLATVNGRNDLDLVGLTPREINGIIHRLRS